MIMQFHKSNNPNKSKDIPLSSIEGEFESESDAYPMSTEEDTKV
jgi:hypothetical protein